MVVNSLGFVLPHISRLGDEEAGNQETPTGADRKAPKKILLSLTKEPRKGEPHKPGSLHSSQISQKKRIKPPPGQPFPQPRLSGEPRLSLSPGYKELSQMAPSCQSSIREDWVITPPPPQSVEILGSLSFHPDPVVMRHNSPNCWAGIRERLLEIQDFHHQQQQQGHLYCGISGDQRMRFFCSLHYLQRHLFVWP
ncbi:uncharacterized protein LOC102734480 [Leptonychotes weddellii]|uniref:Uncharacterized protein LOC102734480 n=1 Tax=Leptonychotes weddellii TaxID=9713 RepID=A0A7F8QUN3_LEPWE|nr:uncharacterized protein LOC102734480 [Leptonychotes weddellii]